MDYLPLIVIAIAVIGIILLFKVVKSILKLAIYLAVLMILIICVFGFLGIKDSKDLVNGISTKSNLYVLKEDNELTQGFRIIGFNLSTVNSFSSSDMKDFNSYYAKKQYSKILGDGYKLFIFDAKAFPQARGFDAASVLSDFAAGNASQEEIDLLKEQISNTQFLGFAYLLSSEMKKDPSFLIKQYRLGNVIVYPETILFKILGLGLKR